MKLSLLVIALAISTLMITKVVGRHQSCTQSGSATPYSAAPTCQRFEHQFGRAPEQIEEVVLPSDADAVAALGWQQMQILAATVMSEPVGIEITRASSDGAPA